MPRTYGSGDDALQETVKSKAAQLITISSVVLSTVVRATYESA